MQLGDLGGPPAQFQRLFQLDLAVEMVLDHALVAAGDEDEMLDAGLARLVDDMLDDGPVDDGQHFLGHGFGGRQEACAEACDGKHGLADGSVRWVDHVPALSLVSGKAGPGPAGLLSFPAHCVTRHKGRHRRLGLLLACSGSIAL